MKQGTGICVFKKLGEKAKELKKAADALQQEEKNGAKGRNWRQNVKVVEKSCIRGGEFSLLFTQLLSTLSLVDCCIAYGSAEKIPSSTAWHAVSTRIMFTVYYKPRYVVTQF
ncbi:hypothetical protein C5167_011591 [Papaver somniferum]|uniref:Uncharacterized protein n=1 Tax=Papaver somniferum TaxID=3469 RepID=A0A4Y7K3F1_PAPSO|nr:hypothetical protein C5167_011591 [Papaver somniferum]